MENQGTNLIMNQASGLEKMMGKSDKNKNKSTTVNSEGRTRIITVTSGKGGVGKTSLSVNLGLAMAKKNKKVLLFDADLGLANINVMLGVLPKYNLYHVVKGHKKLKDIIIQTPEGLDIIAGASGYSSLANLTEAQREKMISEFSELGGYDILLIDTGAGIGSNVIDFTLPADEVIVVTSPEPTSITDAYGVIKSIVLESPEKNIKLLVNRASSSLEGRKVAERVINISNQFLNIKIETVGFIYEDHNVSKSVRKQRPYYLAFPESRASGCLNHVVARVLNNVPFPESEITGGGLGSFFRKLLKG